MLLLLCWNCNYLVALHSQYMYVGACIFVRNFINLRQQPLLPASHCPVLSTLLLPLTLPLLLLLLLLLLMLTMSTTTSDTIILLLLLRLPFFSYVTFSIFYVRLLLFHCIRLRLTMSCPFVVCPSGLWGMVWQVTVSSAPPQLGHSPVHAMAIQDRHSPVRLPGPPTHMHVSGLMLCCQQLCQL